MAGDTNNAHDVFVHDRVTGVTERVSVNDDEEEGDANSGFVFGPAGSQRLAISDDGRFVAFASQATNLVEGDTNNSIDVFLRDRQAGTTERVSVAAGGIEANSFSGSASLSADGRFVAFESGATNLVAGEVDGNGVEDIFVRDRQADTTERVSISDGEQEGDGASQVTAISADGRFVAFKSDATNLTAGADANGAADIFVRDRTGGTTERVSVNSDEEEGDDDCGGFDISSDGRMVVFACQATNLVAGDGNGFEDVFLRDRAEGTTELVSVASGGGVANGASGASFSLSISGDGRSVAFASDATDLVSGDTNGETDVFVRDLVASSTERVSIAEDGSQANDWSSFATAIADSGLVTAFGSAATNLVQGDTNRAVDVFVRTTTRDFRTEYVAKLVLRAADRPGRHAARPRLLCDDHQRPQSEPRERALLQEAGAHHSAGGPAAGPNSTRSRRMRWPMTRRSPSTAWTSAGGYSTAACQPGTSRASSLSKARIRST